MSKKYFKRKYDFNNIQADEFDQSVLEGDDFGFWRSAISIPVFIFVWIFMWSVLSFWGFILLIFGINAIKSLPLLQSFEKQRQLDFGRSCLLHEHTGRRCEKGSSISV